MGDRVPTCARIESEKSDEYHSDSDKSESDVFPSPPGGTFSTASTEIPSYNAEFDDIPPVCASNFLGPDRGPDVL